MYWWNVSKLAEDLREGRVDEKERFKYFLATFIAWNILVPLFIYTGGPFDTDRWVSAAVYLIIAIIGIALCYKVNSSGDNTDFVGRMICLGWPTAIRLALMFCGIVLFVGLMNSVFPGVDGPWSFLSRIPSKIREAWDNFLGLFVIGSYYLDLYRSFASVAKAKGIENAIQTRETDWSTGESALGVVVAVVGGIGVPVVFIWGLGVTLDLGGPAILKSLLGLLPVGLWVLLFGYVLLWLHRRSVKRTVSADNMNQ
jgi:hypothetical protein